MFRKESAASSSYTPGAFKPASSAHFRFTRLSRSLSDVVFFYVHGSVLRARSNNNFGMLLPLPYYSPSPIPSSQRNVSNQQPGIGNYVGARTDNVPPPLPGQPNSIPAVSVIEESEVFNIILHLVYDMPCGRCGPTIESISSALEALPKYGLPTPDPSHEIWTVLLRQVEVDPLRVYSVGAAHAIDMVCIQSSEHTLSTPSSSITEANAMTMGALYLRRLFFLHLGRMEAFKRIAGPPPEMHAPTPACSEVTQRAIQKAWKAALADLLLAEMPQATPVSSVISAFGPVANSTQCSACKEKIQERIASVVQGWGNVKTII